MSENSVEIVAFVQDLDENVNVLNYRSPTSLKSGTKSGGVNGSAIKSSDIVL